MEGERAVGNIRTIYSCAPWAVSNGLFGRVALQLTELLVTMDHCPLAYVAFHIRPVALAVELYRVFAFRMFCRNSSSYVLNHGSFPHLRGVRYFLEKFGRL
jgi:hypothetical protein